LKSRLPFSGTIVCLAAVVSSAAFLTPRAAVAQHCQQKYAVQDMTNLAVVELSYEQDGQWSPNLLAFVLSPGQRQGVEISGHGHSHYRAKLTNGKFADSEVDDICSSNEIVIFFRTAHSTWWSNDLYAESANPMTRKRRLILLLDGTWNDAEASDEDTNIVRLRDILAQTLSATFHTPTTVEEVVEKDEHAGELDVRTVGDFDYMFFYERGVGTGPGFDLLTGGALGWGLGQNVRRAYKFLSRNYRPGSEIFVFGFSRGAYTARTLVGYLGSSALLKEEYCDTKLERTAWTNYRTRPNDRMPSYRKSMEPYVHSFGDLRVACLGVFETVGSLGIPTTVFRKLNREFYEFHDVELSPIVRLNLHALAIDEQRSPFAESVWRHSRFRWSNSVTEQTWFSGVHSDVGGGYWDADKRMY